MNLTQVIHLRWAADATLQALLPASKVMTGLYFQDDPVFPYGTVTLPRDVPETCANDGTAVDTVTVRITVYHDADHYDEGKAIADAVKAAFHRTHFNLAGADKVLNMQRSGYQEIQDPDDGEWYFVLDFACKVYLARGV